MMGALEVWASWEVSWLLRHGFEGDWETLISFSYLVAPSFHEVLYHTLSLVLCPTTGPGTTGPSIVACNPHNRETKWTFSPLKLIVPDGCRSNWYTVHCFHGKLVKIKHTHLYYSWFNHESRRWVGPNSIVRFMWDWDRKVPTPFYIYLFCMHTHAHDPVCPPQCSCEGQRTYYRSSLLSQSGFWGLNSGHLVWQQVPLPTELSRHPNLIFPILYLHRGQFWGLNPGPAFARQVLYHWRNPQLSTFLLSLTFVLPALCLNATVYVTLPAFIPHCHISQKLWNSIYCSSSVSCPRLSPPSSWRVLFLRYCTISSTLVTVSFFSLKIGKKKNTQQ